MDATRKNYYVKYTARVVLFAHLGINLSALPGILTMSNLMSNNPDVTLWMTEQQLYIMQAQTAQVAHRRPKHTGSHPTAALTIPSALPRLQLLKGLNWAKFTMGMYVLAETVGVTLLEPLLAALPRRLQRLRVGPLASPGQYSARDWVMSNVPLCMLLPAYTLLFWKNIFVCGWSPDEFPWNLAGYPNCADMPQTIFEIAAQGPAEFSMMFLPMVMLCCNVVTAPCCLLCLSRKLRGWGEPPASAEPEEAAPELAGHAAKPPEVVKV